MLLRYHVLSLLLLSKFPFDRVPNGTSFGDVVTGLDAQRNYVPGDSANCTFHSANPRNNQRVQVIQYLAAARVDSLTQGRRVC